MKLHRHELSCNVPIKVGTKSTLEVLFRVENVIHHDVQLHITQCYRNEHNDGIETHSN